MNSVSYSPTEQTLIKLLMDSDEPLDVHQLVNLVYAAEPDLRPYHGSIVVRNALNELIKKSQINNEKFAVKRIPQAGKKGALFQIIRNKPSKSLK